MEDTELLRVVVPQGMIEVLQACFGADTALTVDAIVALTSKLLTAPVLPPEDTEGMASPRCANIRNNLGVALYDSSMQKQKQGHEDAAARCFEVARQQLAQADPFALPRRAATR